MPTVGEFIPLVIDFFRGCASLVTDAYQQYLDLVNGISDLDRRIEAVHSQLDRLHELEDDLITVRIRLSKATTAIFRHERSLRGVSGNFATQRQAQVLGQWISDLALQLERLDRRTSITQDVTYANIERLDDQADNNTRLVTSVIERLGPEEEGHPPYGPFSDDPNVWRGDRTL